MAHHCRLSNETAKGVKMVLQKKEKKLRKILTASTLEKYS